MEDSIENRKGIRIGGKINMSKQMAKVTNNIRYVREQIERFMKYNYGVVYDIEVYGNKGIQKEGYYSRLEVKKGRPVAIDISYQLLVKGTREQILKAGLREAIKVVFWYKRKPYNELSTDYIRELRRYNLPVYGNEKHTGKELHTYGCSKCKGVYVLKERKLPPSKDITQQKYVTNCCKERFEYFGKVHYKGEELYRIAVNSSRNKG